MTIYKNWLQILIQSKAKNDATSKVRSAKIKEDMKAEIDRNKQYEN